VGVGDGAFGAGISISTEPPPLPVYDQPIAPDEGYVWTPGYWAWAPAGYFYWVDGAWVRPPAIGLLWTPGWWGWSDGFYRWHPGYWSPRVGFYGGIDYGFGYFGVGYGGGYWRNNRFYYNTAVSRVNRTRIHNTYVDRTVVRNVTVNRVSYNGGRGGVAAQPTAQQRALANERRVAATPAQINRRDEALRNPAQRYDTNRSRFSGDRAPQPAAPGGRAPQTNVIRAPGAGGEPRTNGPQAIPQSRNPSVQGTQRPAAPNRPQVERPSAPVQPSVPGTPRVERGGGSSTITAPQRGPAVRPV